MVEQEIIYNLNTIFTFGGEGKEGSEEQNMWGEGKDDTYYLKVLIAIIF